MFTGTTFIRRKYSQNSVMETNQQLRTAYGLNGSIDGAKAGKFRAPEDLFPMSDCEHWIFGDSETALMRSAYANTCTAGCNTARRIAGLTRHKGSNMLFGDGHVQFYPYLELHHIAVTGAPRSWHTINR